MNSVPCILEFGSGKHCFLIRTGSFQLNASGGKLSSSSTTEQLQVFEVELTGGSKAYFSFLGKSVAVSGDNVQINSFYGAKLGLKDKDPIFLKPIKSVVPTVRKVSVEPLSPDDWEILEQNAGRVETVLLDQVRVVWPGQILPVWVQKSICVYMKIISMEPLSQCGILEANTEIIVAPKTRIKPPPDSLILPSPTKSQHPPQKQQQQQHQQQQQQKLTQQTKKEPESERLVSPCMSRNDISVSPTHDMDTLEPKHSLLSPSRSPRQSQIRSIPKRRTVPLTGSDPHHDRLEVVKPMVQRQSSLMESVMRYIFPSFLDKGGHDFDSRSDSDAGSAIDFTMQNLPSRSAVLRTQAMQLRCTLEECISVRNPQLEVNKQVLSNSFFNWSKSKPQSFKAVVEEATRCNVPPELFQPSTVYVDAECLKREIQQHPYLPRLPSVVIARLQRLPSPNEKAEAEYSARKKSRDSLPNGAKPADMKANVPNNGQKPRESSAETKEKEAGEATKFRTSCYVRVVGVDRKQGLADDTWIDATDRLLSEQALMYGHVIIPDLLRRQLKLDATGSVWLQTGTVDIVIPRKVYLFPISSVPMKFTNEMMVASFKGHIRQVADSDHPLVVFQGMLIKYTVFPGTTLEVQVTFYGDNDTTSMNAVTMLSEININSILVLVERNLKEDKMGVVNPMLAYSVVKDFDPAPPTIRLKTLGSFSALSKEALHHLHACIGLRPLSRHSFSSRAGLSHGVLLITGPKGCGKTSLAKALCRKMSQRPIMAHTTIVDCKTLRGKAVSNIQKILEGVFDEAAWRAPAVIVFDNLDVITPAASGPESEMTGEALYSVKNAQVLKGLTKYEITNNSQIAVIATSKSRSSLHPSLVGSRGDHFIKATLNIGSPDKAAREQILQAILQTREGISNETLKTLNIEPIARKTEGFVARDLLSLVNRALHEKMMVDPEAGNSRVTLTNEEFDLALCNFKPVSIRSVNLHKAEELHWEDVGGLTAVKVALRETLLWPSKYPKLFSTCPLRLRSGVLLYGAPGTGKTLLAGVVAKECGLNFISIKGPELLSKYIGASEQAVRDLFIRAQSAKPCVLFFDEFDSIAPKRGHDSTGVTDRVVNQLLTQLDGVEGLQGVYVLAATSRPDLLDPALLRPGRLDKCLNCPIPDEDERSAILTSLTKKMSLACDVDLVEVAQMCPYFTGADLKALLYNAQLMAIHEQANTDRPLDRSVVRIKGDDTACEARRKASLILADHSFSDKLNQAVEKASSPNDTLNEEPCDFNTSTPKNKTGGFSQILEGALSVKNRNSVAQDAAAILKASLKDLGKQNDVGGDGGGAGDGAGHLFGTGAVHLFGCGGVVQDSVDVVDGTMESKLKISSGEEGSAMVEEMMKSVKNSVEENDRHSAFVPLPSSNEASPRKLTMSEEADVTVVKKPSLIKNSSSRSRSHSREKVAIRITEEVSPQGDSLSLPLSNDPAGTFCPVVDPAGVSKRKRSWQRPQSYPEGSSDYLAVKGDDRHRAKSPSMERPVTVFSSLGAGQISLSPEDEAKYISMMKELQRRDERLFAAANDKRRVSLQLATRPSHLLEVCQRHLVTAAKSMRPSVSQAERNKYLRIYENFVSCRTGDFNKDTQNQMGKRATLA